MESVYVDRIRSCTHYPVMNTTTPPTIITFASPKGGAGKSTSCVNIAGALAAKGHTVHIIDFDQSETLWRWYSNKEAAQAIPNLSVEKGPAHITGEFTSAVWHAPVDFVLIDLAGQLTREMLNLAVFATLTITPVKISEPDIVEANKLLAKLRDVQTRVRKKIIHRLLVNDAPNLPAAYQWALLDELTTAELPRFQTLIRHRDAAYGETFMTGQPPHFADRSRPAISKAVAEIDDLLSEIEAIVANADKLGTIAEATTQQKEAA